MSGTGTYEGTTMTNGDIFLVNTVPIDGTAPLGTKAYAGTVRTVGQEYPV